MDIRYPRPLQPGDTVGVSAPSSGVSGDLEPRLEAGVAWLRDAGWGVRLGESLVTDHVVSAPRERRAAELMAMFRDPTVRAVVPPWGGELAIDLVDLLDYDELATLDPTWMVGYSDISTLLVPLLTRAGWASIHGSCLMETPYRQPDGILHWTEVAAATGPLVQRSPGAFRAEGRDDWQRDPGVSALTLPDLGLPTLVGGGGLDVSGRLVGGCVEVLSPLAGTPYADLRGFGAAHADEGLVVYLEVAEVEAYEVCRAVHGMRLAGWFDDATAVLIGRTRAADQPDLSQHEAIRDGLAGIDVPVVLDAEVGHVLPHFALVNGASTRVVVDVDGRLEITQELS